MAINLLACGSGSEPRPVREGTPEEVEAARQANQYAGPSVSIEQFTVDKRSLGVKEVSKVVKRREEWELLLTPLELAVTRDGGTEIAYTGRYSGWYEPGLYRCVACGTALFHSDEQFDSGTGWPSFTGPVSEHNIYRDVDTSMGIHRTEVLCKRCDAHLGHVFRDGPAPEYKRFCINSAALRWDGGEDLDP